MLLVPSGHQRQRSLCGPSVFASLEVPLTTPETSASSEKKFYFGGPGNGTDTASAKPPGRATPSGLVTPPPSPPVPLEAASRTSSLAESLVDRAPNRSPEKIVSVASSTYEPSVFEGDEQQRPTLGRRLTLDSVRFSSILEGTSTPSSASHRSSQIQGNLTRRQSDATSSSKRSSGVVRTRPPPGARSLSASLVPRSNMELPSLPDDAAASGRQAPAFPDRGVAGMRNRLFTPFQEPMSEPELPSISESGLPSSRARPKRTNTVRSVASARTRTHERSGALAALEGFPCDDGASSNRMASRAPLRPPPTHALPRIPSVLPGPVPSPPAPQAIPSLPRSESFLDFDLSSEDEYGGTSHDVSEPRLSVPSVPNMAAKIAEPPPSFYDRELSARLSSLPFRSDDDHSSWMDRVSREFPQEPQLSRSYSSPLLRSDAQFRPAAGPIPTEVATHEHGRKSSTASKAAASMLSMSSDEEDPDEADWTSAFPRPPET